MRFEPCIVQPLKRDIDGGKADVFIHEFRPPKQPWTYTMVVIGNFASDAITLKIRPWPVSVERMSYKSGKLEICVDVELEELYAILRKFR